MRKRIWALSAVAAMIAACGPKEKVVRIAVAMPLTGDIASLGQGLQRACILALEEAIRSQRFKDFRVGIASFDDRSDPKQAVDVANRIVSDPTIVAVIGHFNSGCSIPAARVYASHHLAMISPAASNPQLTLQQTDPSWTYPKAIFRVNTTDDVQGPFAAEYAYKNLRARAICVIHDKTAYGQGVADEFRKKFEALGGRTLSTDGISVADKDFNALLTRIHESRPDLIYFGGDFAGGGLVVRQARDLGEKAAIMLSEANFDPEFLRVAGPAAEGTYVTFLGSPPDLLPSARAFMDAFRARYPGTEIKAYDHYGYEAMNIVLDLLQKVGPDREKILAALPSVDYKGVLGETRFDAKGDTLNHHITLFQVKDNQFRPLKS
ncbi:MAG TPA: branched-chain amino acid ABC transporter substrate-binding protein [Elusimicrobiota bacterium]|nr:branched-chain amino acid ABC transporter substrate-binding protein [Elusimicrobiota bacterium]